MANNTRTIYEFSTSIGIQIQSDGRWVSTGFQTGWKNNTYDSSTASTIPEPVRQAIANKEFQLAQGDHSPFAVIGRLVKRQGYKPWAMVGFVILGIDNIGRNVPVYRYFCCEAENDESALASMEEILYRVVSYSHDHGKLPFFDPQLMELAKCNPVDKKAINSNITFSAEQMQVVSTDIGNKNLVLLKGFIENSAAGNAYTLIKLNMFAWQRALATGQVVIDQGKHRIDSFAWAYNVESLERPNSFVVIQIAHGSLKQIQSSSHVGFAAGVNEQALLKAVIKEITELDKVDKVIQFSNLLQDENLRDSQFLCKVFDDLGGHVIPKSSHPNSIKLFALRIFLTSSTIFNTFLKWFNQQNPQGKLVNVYKIFEKDFFDAIDAYPKECATLREMVNADVSQAVLKSLLAEDISPESLCVLRQNSRWIKKQNLLDAIRDGIEQVDRAIIANDPFSGPDIWKPLNKFIEKVYRSKFSYSKPKQRIQSNSELPKWLKTILPEFITDHLAERWRDINQSQIKRAEAKEQENRLIKAEAYYIPLAELLRMLCPNTDEHLYFDCISNPQQRLPLAYSVIGSADNTGKKRFNLTVGKSTSLDIIENKLLGQQISFFLLALISVIMVPVCYLAFGLIVMIVGILYGLPKYIFDGFIYIQIEITSNPIKSFVKQQIKILLNVDYTNSVSAKQTVLDCIEATGRILFAQKSKSKKIDSEFTKNVLEELEFELKRSSNSQVLLEKLKFFRMYFLSNDHDEIYQYLEWFNHLKENEKNRALDYQNGFSKILDDIKKESNYKKDYAEPFVADVVNFILSSIIDSRENPTSYKSIIEWIAHQKSFVSSRSLMSYVISDIQQVITPDRSGIHFLCNSNFWDELREDWENFHNKGHRKILPKYKKLAQFFADLSQEPKKKNHDEEYKFSVNLSAYFSQISQGYVSTGVFQKVGQEAYSLKLTLKQADDLNPPALEPLRSGARRNKPKSDPENDYFMWFAMGTIILFILLVLIVGFRDVLFGVKENNARTPIVQPQPATSSNTGSDNISLSPSLENNPTKTKLTCKPSINGEDLDLTISNIPPSTKEIWLFWV